MRYTKRIIFLLICLCTLLFIPTKDVFASAAIQAPQMLSIEPGEGSNSLKITWSQVAGATNYSLYRSESVSDGYVSIATVTANTYTDAGLNTDTNYYYMVYASMDVSGSTVTSDFSGVGVGKVLAGPAQLTATALSLDKIKLTWNNADGANVYAVLRSETSDGAYQWLGVTNLNQYVDTSITTGKEYFYKIQSLKQLSQGWSYGGYSNIVSGKAVIGTPTILTVDAGNGSEALSLTWSAVEGASAYGIARSTNVNGPYTWVSSTSALNYTDAGLNPDTNYYYRVYAARYSNGSWQNGDYSNVGVGKVIAGPSNVTVASEDYNRLNISWNGVSNATAYIVFRGTSQSGPYQWLGLTNQNYFKDTSVATGQTYYYTVQTARQVAGGWCFGGYSASASGKTTLNSPTILTVGPGVGTNSNKITWSSVLGATAYGIYRSESVDGTYTWIGSVTGTSYTDQNLNVNKGYYYKVYAANYANGTWVNGQLSNIGYGKVLQGSSSVIVSSKGYNKLYVQWNAVPNANVYIIFRAESANGPFSYVGVTSQTAFTDMGLTNNKTYYYTIQTAKTVDGSYSYGGYSITGSGYPYLLTPTITSVGTVANSYTISVTWNKDDDADAYLVYRSTDNTNYSCIGLVSSNTFTDYNVANEQTYYYKVMTAKLVNGTWVYSGYSDAKDGKAAVSTKAIDVSAYQAAIDWNSVRANGIEYAMIRAGYRGYLNGNIVTDSKFLTNAAGAQNAGVKYGLYFVTQAVSAAEAVEEANYVISWIQSNNLNVSLPIAVDTEYSPYKTGRADTLDVNTRTQAIRAFCDTIRSYGYTPMIYASKDWFASNLYMSQLSGIDMWVARYPTLDTGDIVTSLKPNIGEMVWQYSSKGSVSGVPTKVDMDIFYKRY